jgi:hypothetical protein
MITLLFTIVLIFLAIVLLGIKVFLVKGGRFPSHHRHAARPKTKSE